jgi:hypothetical protein
VKASGRMDVCSSKNANLLASLSPIKRLQSTYCTLFEEGCSGFKNLVKEDVLMDSSIQLMFSWSSSFNVGSRKLKQKYKMMTRKFSQTKEQ